jgi:phage gp36-like protein
MAIATVNNLIDRFDVRELGQLASDTNIPLNATQLQTATPVLAALQDATGVLMSALYVAFKYTQSDIDIILNDQDTGPDADDSLALLVRIVCDLAVVYLAQRRGRSYKEKFPLVQESLDLIQKLRNGERVLNLMDKEKAGLTQQAIVTVCDQVNAGLVQTAWRYFPLPVQY